MLKETCLVEAHKKLGGKLVDFGGWNMPLHYGSQLEEHHAVRQDAGMFDVSHMTVVDVSGEEAKTYLRYLFANDVDKLKTPGKALYTAMLNDEAGVVDDLIVYLTAEGYRLVVNCATREKDLAWMEKQSDNYTVQIEERPELAMLAVQGPEARDKVNELIGVSSLRGLSVFQGVDLTDSGLDGWWVARTGYTGEEGYEIILPASEAESFWERLLEKGVRPCGLGARDTLRLEAGMNLYGHEMDDNTSPLAANMGWTVSWEPEERAFVGRTALESVKYNGAPEKLVGLVFTGKGVLRAGQEVILADTDKRGIITSGSFSPTLGHSIALARVPAEIGDSCEVLVRNKRLPVNVVGTSFVRNGNKVF